MTNPKGNPIPHPAWNKGKKWPAEIREKISQGMRAYWQVDRDVKLERLRSDNIRNWSTNHEAMMKGKKEKKEKNRNYKILSSP